MTGNDGIPITKSFNYRNKIKTAVRYGPCQETILSGLSEDLSVGGRYLKTNVPLDLNETLKGLIFSAGSRARKGRQLQGKHCMDQF